MRRPWGCTDLDSGPLGNQRAHNVEEENGREPGEGEAGNDAQRRACAAAGREGVAELASSEPNHAVDDQPDEQEDETPSHPGRPLVALLD